MNKEELEYEVSMAIDEIVISTAKEIDESCNDLVNEFNDYDKIINYLSNKYDVIFM